MSHKNSEKNRQDELETTYLYLACFRVPRVFSRASHVCLACLAGSRTVHPRTVTIIARMTFDPTASALIFFALHVGKLVVLGDLSDRLFEVSIS